MGPLLLPAIIACGDGLAAIVFSSSQAELMFENNGTKLRFVVCVNPPRSLLVTNCADAATFFSTPNSWHPISSAPRDGTVIDVWLGDADEADVAFYCTPGTRRAPGWSWRDGKFRPLGGLPVSMPTFVRPTHWMPIPEGPP